MALTTAEVAFAIRLEQTSDAAILKVVERHIATATAMLDRRCSASLPEAMRDEATVRIAAWLYDAPFLSRGDVWTASGAGDLVRSWTVRGSALVESETT